MTKAEFQIKSVFYTAAGAWVCTDLGSRVVVAVKKREYDEERGGPPYSVVERVFDEYDFGGCTLVPWTNDVGVLPVP